MKYHKIQKIGWIPVVLAVAAIGVTMHFSGRAATASISLEPEVSTLSKGAVVASDSNASSGKAVKFTSPVSTIWKPALNSPFMWLLAHPLDVNNVSDMGTGVKDYLGNTAPDPIVYDIDGFDNPATTITSLHARGAKVVCYISGGTSEDWRSDYSSFTAAVKGNTVDGWAGENWLDVRNTAVLLPIMQSRVSMCAQKGFDAVEFDNVDGYTNSTGFPLTAADQINYNTALAGLAHNAGLSAALKNDVDQIADLYNVFDFAVNEECNTYNECGNYKTYFVANGKAVFQIEYSKATSTFCPAMNTANINSVRLPLNLNGNRQPCR